MDRPTDTRAETRQHGSPAVALLAYLILALFAYGLIRTPWTAA